MATEAEDKALMDLYEALKANNRRTSKFTLLDEAARREYKRRHQAESRATQKAAAEAGSPLPTTEAIREALADVALRMLATDASGAAELRLGLSQAFPGRVGVPEQVTRRAKSGGLKPRLLKSS
jgi:hypothetical protein